VNRDLDKDLAEDFPTLYTGVFRGEPWGFSCGDGWEPIIRILSRGLVEWAVFKGKPKAYWAIQVKERDGGLSVSMSSTTEEMDRLIAEAELHSLRVCEMCGKPGNLRGIDWPVTRCDTCFEKGALPDIWK
jgi:hypothetical protein